MTEDRLVSLITRQLSGELASEEAQELNTWAEMSDTNRQFLRRFTEEELLRKEIEQYKRFDPAAAFDKTMAEIRSHRKAKVRRIMTWSAAACVVVAVGILGLHKPKTTDIQSVSASAPVTQPGMPGRNTATLTLASGQQILLDSAGKGQLALQGSTRVVKADSGQLSYEAAGQGNAVGGSNTTSVAYNVLTTPKSGQYQLTLPDGSKVWLNNITSLRYPTAFVGKERIVELTGEAYFEIAKDAARPFKVKLRDEIVEVLGTGFNVMAYPDEGGTQTTLLSGGVKVETGSDSALLQPDEQAQVKADGALKVVKDVPAEDIVSWKNGFFYFGRSASFEAVMRQLARWYDVEVVYEGKAPQVEFGGKIDRSLPLNDLLKFLDKNQIHFRLDGRKLMVLP